MESLPGENSYKPLFMMVAGKFVAPPDEGFGTDYKAAFFATQFIGVSANRTYRTVSNGGNVLSPSK
jgi:hypothetical protein